MTGAEGVVSIDEKELRHLSRIDLLEMLLKKSREVDLLKRELEETRSELHDRQIKINRAGSIAEAALKLNEVFEAAQKAADQYLENIRYAAGTEEGTNDEKEEV